MACYTVATTAVTILQTMSKPSLDSLSSQAIMHRCIQKVATGPEYSKDLRYDEAYHAMRIILDGEADPIQAGIYLIAMRMKRETDTENRASLQAIQDSMSPLDVAVDDLFVLSDAFDGWLRGLPVGAFVGPVLAACGIRSVAIGLESVGPKHGITPYRVLQAAGISVNVDMPTVKTQLEHADMGWAYSDQRHFCPALHALLPLRETIIKRPLITTLESLTRPYTASGKTHLMTGYVHKAYPPVYTSLARAAAYDSALVVRGVEGGITPSLLQAAKCYSYHDDGEDQLHTADPHALSLQSDKRCPPLPDDAPTVLNIQGEARVDATAAAMLAAEAGLAALNGKSGHAYDSLVYASALALWHVGKASTYSRAGELARHALDSGAALGHFKALQNHHS